LVTANRRGIPAEGPSPAVLNAAGRAGRRRLFTRTIAL
jgi:hypothetical protein